MQWNEPGADFWNERYASVDRVWAKQPNALLTEFAAELPAGRAVDIGAGEGRNAIWLAERGWTVTAIDISDVGLGRAAERAAEEGVALEIVVGDWRDYKAPAPFDLAVISFMHPRENHMFEWAWDVLAPGGHLFTVGVDLSEHGKRGPKEADKLYTPERLRAALAGFDVLRCEKVAYQGESTEGPRPVVDSVAIARRPSE